MSNYFILLKDHFADTIQKSVKNSNLRLGRSHCFELIASFFGFNTYAALMADGFLSTDRYQDEPTVDLKKFTERAQHLGISDQVTDIVKNCLLSLHGDEQDYLTSLVKRLTRNIKRNCNLYYDYRGPIFDSHVFLNEEDWESCGDIAASDEFEDYLFTDLPLPSLGTIVAVHNHPIDGLYQMNPDPILNILAFVAPSQIDQLLQEMRVR
ncbi:TPA: hypothetical protein PKT77_003769 [Acinetobacter baumannii]|uniref:hypothetical protein n=1 Tax=Acinetobacter baumannii TaxID=470 RepID=UPI00165ED8DA|nr:hypothetical protein [Acinetobacter baumannii]MBD0080600.1 hypothetical protein [Acinetobacter baumannii]MBP4313672.1 hypothetical protein [Acinetobacter baumannii]MBP4677392.1 hypothetical protein [Acinetobacter baumannii]MBP5038780.1 hypothetical protein [Acinetobacter baumannii]MCA4088187.1 hypothetical protein [Acinetobacter baumannii]